MEEQNPLSQQTGAPSLNDLSTVIARLSEKVSMIQTAVQYLNLTRAQLEDKIDVAQKRIQHILSRLPEQTDGRQLNLLGEAVAPTNPEDDNEPTTH